MHSKAGRKRSSAQEWLLLSIKGTGRCRVCVCVCVCVCLESGLALAVWDHKICAHLISSKCELHRCGEVPSVLFPRIDIHRTVRGDQHTKTGNNCISPTAHSIQAPDLRSFCLFLGSTSSSQKMADTAWRIWRTCKTGPKMSAPDHGVHREDLARPNSLEIDDAVAIEQR